MPGFKLKAAALAAMLLCGAMAGQIPQPSEKFPDIPRNLKPYFIALLVKGPNADQPQTSDEREALLRGHMAYLRSQVEAGKYAVVGPFLDNGNTRGMAVIRAASAEEARQLASADPMVRSGRMAIEDSSGCVARPESRCGLSSCRKRKNDRLIRIWDGGDGCGELFVCSLSPPSRSSPLRQSTGSLISTHMRTRAATSN